MHKHESEYTRMAIMLTRFRANHPDGFVRSELMNALLTRVYRAISDEDRERWKPFAVHRYALILQKFRDRGEARFNRETRRCEWNETGPILRFLEQEVATSCNTSHTNTLVAC